MQHQRPPHPPLIAPAPRVRRQDKYKLFSVVASLTLIAAVAFVVTARQQGTRRPFAASIPVETAVGSMPSASSELRLPSSYAQVSLLPPPVPEPVAVTPVVVQPVSTANPFVQPPPPLQGVPGSTEPPAPRTPPAQVQRTPPPRREAVKPPSKWLFADLKPQSGVQEPPFPVAKEDESASGQGRSKAAQLFPQAVWATPADPTKVLYRSQLIHGLTQHDINSDQPGLIRVLVTEAVHDRFGQGRTLLPQYTIVLGTQDGKVAFGQSRLGITIDSAELPDGTVVVFTKATVGDATGASGAVGKVDNHYLQLGIGAVLSAALSVGSRAVAGSPTGFQPTLEQEFARDVGSSFNQTGQQIIRQRLDVPPTITIPHGTPVTVQLSENVSFQTPGAIMRK